MITVPNEIGYSMKKSPQNFSASVNGKYTEAKLNKAIKVAGRRRRMNNFQFYE